MYKIRIVLDTKEDVIRTLLVDENCNLEELHFMIATSFGFAGKEMASFYRTDSEWNQGEEIPLFNMAEIGEGISMATQILKEVLHKKNDTLLYIYDFLKLWTFYVEVIDISDEKIETLPKVVLSMGDVPSEAPEKEFISDNPEGGDSEDDFNEYGDYDEYDYSDY